MNRVKLRETVFKMLYCNEFHSKDEMPKQFELFWDNFDEIKELDTEFVTKRVNDIVEKIDLIDEEINKVSEGWNTDRMSKVDLTILRLAYFEMKMDEDIPQKVAVDQAVELAKKYAGDSSPAFINGILAKLF